MKFLLFYKGHYGKSLRGPEMRYLSLAKELAKEGHYATLVARNYDSDLNSSKINFINLKNKLDLIVSVFTADCILLHGGGLFILTLSILASFIGKKVILDNYVPHWIELDEKMLHEGKSAKLAFKSSFNVFRTMLATFLFDQIIVANTRQKDLVRGFSSVFFKTSYFNRIETIPFGCEDRERTPRTQSIEKLNALISDSPKLKESDFLIGWLGGTYGWFDLDSLLTSASSAFQKNSKIKLIFFGVDDYKKSCLLNAVPTDSHSNLLFLPWIDFSSRFEFWSAFDISLVWGGDGYENDYASRTRNFDCMALGLPVVQNHDDEWGTRLAQNGAGIIANKDNIAEHLFNLSYNLERIEEMRSSMKNLASNFFWSRFSEKIIKSAQKPNLSFLRRVAGLLLLFLCLPPITLAFIITQVFPLSDRELS